MQLSHRMFHFFYINMINVIVTQNVVQIQYHFFFNNRFFNTWDRHFLKRNTKKYQEISNKN